MKELVSQLVIVQLASIKSLFEFYLIATLHIVTAPPLVVTTPPRVLPLTFMRLPLPSF